VNVGDAVSTNPSQGLARSSAPSPQVTKRGPGQMPDAAAGVPKPRSQADEPERPLIRPHPAASTEESLQRLPEARDSIRLKLRARKDAAQSEPGMDKHTAATHKPARPYDPPAETQHDLDILV
jgi:hypothetical protein